MPQDAAAREKAESLYFEAVQPLLQQREIRRGDRHPEQGQGAASPNSAQLELALGVAYYGLRRFDEAAGAFLRTIAIAPEVEQPYIFLGKFLDQIPGRLPEVTEAVRPVRERQSRRAPPDTCCTRRRSTRSRSSRKLPGNCSRRRSAIDERDAAAHFELGAVFDRTRHYADAAREFERAAELDPPMRRRTTASPASTIGWARPDAAQARARASTPNWSRRSRKRSAISDRKKGGPPKRTA